MDGFTDVVSIQNRSGNGIDVIARAADGRLRFFEVKASAKGDVGALSRRQKDMTKFVRQVLNDAATGEGRYKRLDAATRANAQRFAVEIRGLKPEDLSGTVIGVNLRDQVIRVSPWR